MSEFKIVSDFHLTGDQPQAVDKLVEGLEKGYREQTLVGVTGSGKTFTMATEFKESFPENAVEYFVSYYDYYQPEAYIPSTDLYIERELPLSLSSPAAMPDR